MRWSIKNSFSKRNYRLLRKKRIIGSNLPKSFLNTIWNWQTREQMKKNFICSKKSVRTFKLRIEPYFLSHAERGKPFWILDSEGGGLEPPRAFARLFSRQVHYHSANPPRIRKLYQKTQKIQG